MAEGGSSSFVQPAIPRFNGHYDHWAMLMENFLRSKEYWDLIENGILMVADGIEPTEAQCKLIEEQKLKDLKVKNYLFQAIDREVLETILKRDTTKNIWDSMYQNLQPFPPKKSGHVTYGDNKISKISREVTSKSSL